MNWGKGIVIAMSTFIVFIVVLATIMMTSKIDLESDDYYKQEIAFEEEIKALTNANALDKGISINQTKESISFEIPVELKAEKIRVAFHRPNDQSLDVSFDIAKGEHNTIPSNMLKKGKYKVEISYLVDDKICLQKDEIII